MAITFDAKGNAFGNGGATATLTRNITIGSLTNGILVVAFNPTTGSGALSAVRLDSSSGAIFSQVAGAPTVQSGSRTVDLWFLLAPPSGAHSIWVSAASAVFTPAIMSTWNGVDQITPFGTVATDNGTDPSGATPTSPTGGLVLSFSGGQFNDNTPTQDVSETLLYSGIGISDSTEQLAGSYKFGSGPVPMIWTGDGGGAHLAVAMNPSGATNIKTVNGLSKGSVKTWNGLATASVKTVVGLA